ncbi:response regulator [Sphingomonas sp. ASV193]|uniref:response regulator n=1 Tax=Sphingomonas sp. ASV193 TaxID=3144405 RepID=UPI0032E8B87D
MTAPFLVLEDEPFIALDLKMAFEDAGSNASVAGSVDEALDILRDHAVRGAVLDVNLGRGQTCWPVAEYLATHGIPFILHTGDLDREGERLRSLNVPIVAKPALAEDVVERLLGIVAARDA